MSKFDFFTEIDLSTEGEQWQGSYLRFNPLTVGEIQQFSSYKDASQMDDDKAIAEVLNILTSKFREGQALAGGELTAVTKEDLTEFPIPILLRCMEALTAGMDAKKKNQSLIPSEESQEPSPLPS